MTAGFRHSKPLQRRQIIEGPYYPSTYWCSRVSLGEAGLTILALHPQLSKFILHSIKYIQFKLALKLIHFSYSFNLLVFRSNYYPYTNNFAMQLINFWLVVFHNIYQIKSIFFKHIIGSQMKFPKWHFIGTILALQMWTGREPESDLQISYLPTHSLPPNNQSFQMSEKVFL